MGSELDSQLKRYLIFAMIGGAGMFVLTQIIDWDLITLYYDGVKYVHNIGTNAFRDWSGWNRWCRTASSGVMGAMALSVWFGLARGSFKIVGLSAIPMLAATILCFVTVLLDWIDVFDLLFDICPELEASAGANVSSFTCDFKYHLVICVADVPWAFICAVTTKLTINRTFLY